MRKLFTSYAHLKHRYLNLTDRLIQIYTLLLLLLNFY